MSKNTYIIIAIVVLVVFGGFLLLQGSEVQAPGEEQDLAATEALAKAVVTYTDSGYSPKEVALLQGGTVTFENQSSGEMWPATALHPTHTVYPGSDIQKCGTGEQPRLFDACEGIAPGGTWSFQFQETGAWWYHDHLNVPNTGKIIVE